MSSLFFGKKKAPPKPKADTGAALQGITDHLEMLEKKEAHLAGQILDSKKQAHALNKSKKKTDKTKALQIMRTIKMKEKQQAQIVGTINNMTSQKLAIEGIAMTSATVNVMETTKAALDGAIDLDKAEDTIADVQEGMERAAELADAVSQPMDGGMMPMDEEELMAELDMLDEELDDEVDIDLGLADLEVASTPLSPQLTAADILANAPSAPTAAPAQSDQAAAELADLMAFAN